jgi:hypothetical protein
MAIIHILERQAQELGLGVGGRCLLPTRLRITGRFCFLLFSAKAVQCSTQSPQLLYNFTHLAQGGVVDMAADDAVYSP